MEILPFVVDYWKLFADKVIVYDNYSTDKSVEYLQQFGDWIEVRHFETRGQDNAAIRDIKNKVWKDDDADWIVISDLDECLFAKDGIKNVLEAYDKGGIGLIYPSWYVLVSDEKPVYDGRLLHEIRPNWYHNQNEAKPLIFKPKYFEEMNFSAGQHKCSPTYKERCSTLKGGAIYCLHTEGRLSPEYYLAKCHMRATRRSPSDIKYHFGTHYGKSDSQIMSQWNKFKSGAETLDFK